MMKILKSILIALLFIVIAGGIAAGLFFGITRCADIPLPKSEADSPSDNEPEGAIIAISDKGEKLYEGGIYTMPEAVTMLGGSKELTISVPVSNPYLNYAFVFTCNFVAGSNDWSRGKNASKYLSVIYADEGTAKVKVLQLFEVPIEVQARQIGTDSYSTCKVDCLSRTQGMSASLIDCDFGNMVSAGVTVYPYAAGTVRGNIEFTSGSLRPEFNFVEFFTGLLDFDVSVKDYVIPESVLTSASYLDEGFSSEFELCIEYSMFIEDFDSFDEQQQTDIYHAWFHAYYTYKMQFNVEFYVDVQYVYNDMIMESYSDVVNGWMVSGYSKGYVPLPEIEFEEDLESTF